MKNKELKGTVMILLSAIFFGLMPFFALRTYAEGFDVNNLLLYRYCLAFIMIALYCFVKKIPWKLNRLQFILLFFISFVGTMLTTYTLFLSYRYISSGLATTLHFVYPVITLVLASILYKEKFSLRKLIALILSLVGIGLLSLVGDNKISMAGIIWALVSGLFYAIYIIGMAHKELKKLSPFTVVFWIFGITAFLFFVKCILTDSINTHHNLSSLFYTLNLSFWSTFLAVILFYKGMKYIGPGKASLLSTFEPLTGVLVGVFVFREKLDSLSVLAIVLILFSVFALIETKRSFFASGYSKFKEKRIIKLKESLLGK